MHATVAQGPHAWKGSMFDLMPPISVLESVRIFEQGASCFHFALSPANNVDTAAQSVLLPLSTRETQEITWTLVTLELWLRGAVFFCF